MIFSQSAWYFLPAFFANMAPVVAARWTLLQPLNKAIDGGKMLGGERLLGDHKTWRGLLTGLCMGAIIAAFQFTVRHTVWVETISLINWSNIVSAMAWGALLGFGALCGDSAASFIKRRLHKKSGESWQPWDQLNAIIGAILLSQCIAPISFIYLAASCVIALSGTYLISSISVKIKIKESL